MHEIITLQFGEQANYLATHFWNIQNAERFKESYFTYDERTESAVDHDIHFRSGVAADGSNTYTPRTLIYDFKKSFGSLRKINELYQIFDEQAEQQSSEASTYRLPPILPHQYQLALNDGTESPDLSSDNIRYWSDFNRVFYHPKSVVQIYEDELNPQQRAFEHWQDGVDLFESLQRESDQIDDQLRPLVEDCDQMQGFQILAQVDNGWGGFTSDYLERMRDEYGKSCIVVNALHGLEEGSVFKRASRRANQARALHRLVEHSSLYVPLTASPAHLPPSLDFRSQHPWCSSALQAIAFESMLLPTRLKATSDQTPPRLDEIVASHNAGSEQKIAELNLRIIDVLGGGSADANGTNGTNGQHHLPEYTTEFLPFASHSSRKVRHSHATAKTIRSLHEDEDEQHDMTDRARSVIQCNTDLAFPILDSFPLPYGRSRDSRYHGLRPMTSFSRSSVIAEWAQSLEAIVRRQAHPEEREELIDGLRQIASAYRGSESDDDFDDE